MKTHKERQNVSTAVHASAPTATLRVKKCKRRLRKDSLPILRGILRGSIGLLYLHDTSYPQASNAQFELVCSDVGAFVHFHQHRK